MGRSEPSYTGIQTFARLPFSRDLSHADVAIVGIPFDGGTSGRPGQRFGPDAIRAGSVQLKGFDRIFNVDVMETLDIVDWGSIWFAPGTNSRAVDQIADQLAEILQDDIIPVVLGGDHTVLVAELRGLAEVHGPLALVSFDAHPDTANEYGGEKMLHGTPLRRAAEEGILCPENSLIAGLRGSLEGPREYADAAGLGFDLIPWDELSSWSMDEFGARVQRRIGDRPAFLSFDIDFIDPAFAPATGTPEPGGPSASEALDLLAALTEVDFVGYDLVEVAPAYDGPAAITARLAAQIVFRMLALTARARSVSQSASP